MLTGRWGFSLVEILVALAIGLVLAAAVLPSLFGTVDQSRVEESAASLDGLAEAIGSMHADVGQYPARLSHLTTPITGADTDLCGTAFASPANWAGPYINRSVPATGLPLPIGSALDALSYTAGPPLLRVTVEDVTEEDARALNAEVDADGYDASGGAIRWGAVSGSGLVDVQYVRPVRSC